MNAFVSADLHLKQTSVTIISDVPWTIISINQKSVAPSSARISFNFGLYFWLSMS